MADISDPSSIVGVSRLVNPHNVRKNINLEAIEKELVGNSGSNKDKSDDIERKYNNELSNIAKDLGISFDDDLKSTRGSIKSVKTLNKFSTIKEHKRASSRTSSSGSSGTGSSASSVRNRPEPKFIRRDNPHLQSSIPLTLKKRNSSASASSNSESDSDISSKPSNSSISNKSGSQSDSQYSGYTDYSGSGSSDSGSSGSDSRGHQSLDINRDIKILMIADDIMILVNFLHT